MESPPWRVVIVRAWRHADGVAAVLRVSGSGAAARRTFAAGSSAAALAALAAVLEELTGDDRSPPDRLTDG